MEGSSTHSSERSSHADQLYGYLTSDSMRTA